MTNGTFPYEDVLQSITARHIQTPVNRLIGFETTTSVASALGVLERNRFDFAPVFEGEQILGRVALSRLIEAESGSIGDHLEPLRGSFLVTSDSKITNSMRWLATDPWLVVVDGQDISGIITPSDLNRQGARTYFYLLVADFEIRLAEAVRERFEDQADAIALLPTKRRHNVERLRERAAAGDIDSDAVAAMFLEDLLIIADRDSGIRDDLGHVKSDDWDWANSHLVEFRNNIMHPVTQLLDDTTGLDRLIEKESRLRRLAGASSTSQEQPADNRG